MKRFFNIFPYALLLLVWVLACTKDVGLITEVEFELTENHEDKGFINQALATTVTVVPEVVHDDYNYSFTYSTPEGVGYFADLDGKTYSLTEKIPFNPLSSSVVYRGTEKGTHVVKIEAQDNFGQKKETQITYTIIDVPVKWEANSPVSQVELGKSVAIAVTLGVSPDAVGVSYERNYAITTNNGELTSTEGSVLQTDQYSTITAGTYELVFTPVELGPATVEFRLRDSNGQELSTLLNFEVIADIIDTTAPELKLIGADPFELFLGASYEEPGATAIDDIDGDISERIAIDASEIDTTTEGTYLVSYTVSDDDGNTSSIVRQVNVVRDPNGNAPPIANDDSASTGINEAVDILVLQNDTDSDTELSELTISSVSPHNPEDAGILEFDPRTIRFTPSTDFEGEVAFTYTITDGNVGNTATASVTLTIRDENIAQTGIEVSPETIGLEVGGSQQLSARILPANATNQNVRWSSSDANIATVDNNGNVSAVSKGTATIIATSLENSDLMDSAVVTVSTSAILIEGIIVTRNRSSISNNETEQFTANISPANATNQTISWASDNTDVATVDTNTGLVTGVSKGIANIVATARDGSGTRGSASINVAVVDVVVLVSGITVTRDRSSIQDTETEKFTAIVNPANATNNNVTWTSDDISVATVEAATGLVTAVSEGTAIITATAVDGSGIEGSASITVTTQSSGILVNNITVTRDRSTISENETEQFNAVIAPSNATNQTLNWTSDNTDVATVNSNTGLVTAVADGDANIIATATDGSGTTGAASITVNEANTSIPITQITVTRNRSTILDNETEQFSTVIAPSNATNQTVSWTSDNTGIATVDGSSGLVTAVAEGDANIIATATDSSGTIGSASITVDASVVQIPVNSITVRSGVDAMRVGTVLGFSADVLPTNATNTGVTWTSDNPAIATVDTDTGAVTGVARGMASITATAVDGSGVSGSRGIEVTPNGSPENDITYFSYPHISGTAQINTNDHTVEVKVFTGTDRTVAPRSIEVSDFATINPGAIGRNFYDPAEYTVTAQNRDPQLWIVTITEDTNNSKEITRFSINGIDGEIRGTDIIVSMPAGTDRSTLTPIIVHTGISVFPESGSQQDLRNQKQYIVKSNDGSEVIYTVDVILLQ